MGSPSRGPDPPGYDIALTILGEVVSIYPHRRPQELLVAAGTLALGREPCPNSKSWARAVYWGQTVTSDEEHGIQRRAAELDAPLFCEYRGMNVAIFDLSSDFPWRPGCKLRLYPNHACIAGAMYDYYVVVDGDVEGGERVVDVWPRCRGW